MQAYHIERMAGEPILLLTFADDYDGDKYRFQIFADAWDILESVDEPYSIIADMRNRNLKEHMVVEAGSVGTTGVKPVFLHPNFRQIIFISQNLLVRVAVKSYQSDIFFNINAKIFETLEEALAYCRSN